MNAFDKLFYVAVAAFVVVAFIDLFGDHSDGDDGKGGDDA